MKSDLLPSSTARAPLFSCIALILGLVTTTQAANRPPVVANPLPDVVIGNNVSAHIELSRLTFSDPDISAGLFDVINYNVSGLPPGLTFTLWPFVLSAFGVIQGVPTTLGSGTVTVTATDLSSASVSDDFVITVQDRIPPTIALTGVPSNPSKLPYATFTFSGTENVPPPPGLTFQCNLDGVGWINCSSPFTTPTLSDANHSIAFRSIDAAGNISALASHSWRVDFQRPTVTISHTSLNRFASTASFVFPATDNDTPASGLVFQRNLDGTGYGVCSDAETFGPLGEGPHTLSVIATDLSGNASVTVTYGWTVDTVPPDTSILSGPASPNKGFVHFTISGTDSITPAASLRFEYSLNGGGSYAAVLPGPGGGFSLLSPADGPITLLVRAIDLAANKDATPATYSWIQDGTPPTISIVGAPPAIDRLTSPTFTFVTSDNLSPASNIRTEYSLNNGASFSAITPNSSPGSVTLAGLANGGNRIVARASDEAGNQSPLVVYDWTIDTQPPDTFFVSSPLPPGLSGSATAYFAVNSTDPSPSSGPVLIYNYRLFLNGVDPGADLAAHGDSINLLSLVSGSYRLEVRAVDRAGNVDATPAVHSWTVDTSSPTVTILTRPENPTNGNGGLVFTFTGTDTITPPAGLAYWWRLDAGVFQSGSSPRSLSAAALADGLHTFEVYAVDADGNQGPAAAYTWYLDKTPPTVSLVTTPPVIDANPNASFSFAGTDVSPPSGIAPPPGMLRFLSSLDGAVESPLSSPVSFSGLGDGAHTFTTVAVDPAGNRSTVARHDWVIDTRPPNTFFVSSSLPPSPSGSATAYFAVGSTDPAPSSGAVLIYNYRLFFNGVDPGVDLAAHGSSVNLSALVSGTYRVEVRAVDSAGNVDLSPAVHMWTVDTSSPTTLILSRPENPTNGVGGLLFTFRGTDTVTAPADLTFKCRLDGNPFATVVSPSFYASPAGLADGLHTFEVFAIDADGNQGPVAAYTWYLDTTPPTVSLLTAPPAIGNNAAAGFSFSGTDVSPLSGIAPPPVPLRFLCSLDGAMESPCASPMALPGLTHGPHTFAVVAVDRAGNRSAVIRHDWVVDLQPPGTTLLSFPADPTASTSASFTFSGVDTDGSAVHLFEYTLDGVVTSPAITAGTVSFVGLTPGVHLFTVAAIDPAGNKSAPVSKTWNIDVSAPVIAYCARNQTLTAPATCSTPLPNLTALISATDDSVPLHITQSPAAGTLVGIGTHVVTLTVRDALGNASTCSATVTVQDSTPPLFITCPPPSSPAFVSGCGIAIPNLVPGAVATDCNGPVVITQSPAPGTRLRHGLHLVTLTARDAANNTAACTTTLNIIEPPGTNCIEIVPNLLLTTLSDGNLQASFAGNLQFSTAPGGPFTDIPGALSPYVIPPTGPGRYFRSRLSNEISGNVVGYYNRTLLPGYSLVAHQLDNGVGNRLIDILRPDSVPDGTMVFKQNGAGYDQLTAGAGQWIGATPQLAIAPGEAVFVFIPGPNASQWTFSGEVPAPPEPLPEGRCAAMVAWPRPEPVPISTLVGRTIADDATVYRFESFTSTFREDTHLAGTWFGDGGGLEPVAGVGEAFFLSEPGAVNCMLVPELPTPLTVGTPPRLAISRPAPGTEATPNVLLEFLVIEGQAALNSNSVQLRLDGNPVGISILRVGGTSLVHHQPAGLLATGQHVYELIAADFGTPPRTASLAGSFLVSPTTQLPLPVITEQPVGMTVAAGEHAELRVTAFNDPGRRLLVGLVVEGAPPPPGQFRPAAAGDPTPGIDVSLDQNPGRSTFARVTSSQDGTFTFTGLAAGSYLLHPVTNASVAVCVTLAAVDPGTVQIQGAGVLCGPVPILVQPEANPPSYQWLHNGQPIAGATNDVLSFANVSSSHVGIYTIRVSNPQGTTESGPAVLAIAPLPLLSFAVVPGGGAIQFMFNPRVNETGHVERTLSLNPPHWTVVQTVVGNGDPQMVSEPISTGGQGFFRLRMER